MRTSKRKDEAWEWIKFCATQGGHAARDPAAAAPRRPGARWSTRPSTAARGRAHWQVFYDTLDRFPTTGPIPAPPQQAAVETALIKNVLGRRDGLGRQRRGPRSATMQRDLELALEEDVMVNIAPPAAATTAVETHGPARPPGR